jgi:hypothetical protein
MESRAVAALATATTFLNLGQKAGASIQAEFYVSLSGADTNLGTLASPFKTIDKGNSGDLRVTEETACADQNRCRLFWRPSARASGETQVDVAATRQRGHSTGWSVLISRIATPGNRSCIRFWSSGDAQNTPRSTVHVTSFASEEIHSRPIDFAYS